MAGVAMLSKSTGFFLIPFAGLLALWTIAARWARGQESLFQGLKRSVIEGLQWAALAILSFVILWPAIWVIPFRALNVIFSIGSKYA